MKSGESRVLMLWLGVDYITVIAIAASAGFKPERHDGVAWTGPTVTAGCDNHVLGPGFTDPVADGRGIARVRQSVAPEFFAGQAVKCSEIAITGGADEIEFAGGGQAATNIGTASLEP